MHSTPLSNLSSQFPVWFCDVWGVLHNGIEPFAAAVEALQRHRGTAGKVILVSNSPRSAEGLALQLGQIGVSRDSWDAIVTSGDVTRTLMTQHGGGKLYHIGPDRDLSLFAGLDVQRVSLHEAHAVICSGLFHDDTEQPQDYDPLLKDIALRGLAMICANPDKLVRKGTRLLPCAGALAERFEALDGKVLMAGKPFTPIYELALTMAAAPKDAVLAIGDGLETDIRGAATFGLPAVFISGGVNQGDMAWRHALEAIPGARILATMDSLDWQ
jgi:HAD superfamily hydrolase (TIGR01459 family)